MFGEATIERESMPRRCKCGNGDRRKEVEDEEEEERK